MFNHSRIKLCSGPVKRKCMLDDGESTPSKRHSSNLLITHTTRAAPYKVSIKQGLGSATFDLPVGFGS